MRIAVLINPIVKYGVEKRCVWELLWKYGGSKSEVLSAESEDRMMFGVWMMRIDLGEKVRVICIGRWPSCSSTQIESQFALPLRK